MVNTPPGRLYVVATPIGNLGDFSPRARETLASCGLIAAEDTRHTGLLLKHFGINTPQISLHDHNESSRISEILTRLRQGISVALVSDAGTPAISDPGFELVRSAVADGFEVRSVPGPCAAIAALSIGALPTERFCFEGFLAARGAARRRQLESLQYETRTLVFYESPHRIAEMLADCALLLGAARAATLVREATKVHENVYRGSLKELAELACADENLGRGEIVVLIAGAQAAVTQNEALLDRALLALLKEMPLKQAARLAAEISGARDNEAYKRALTLKEG